MRLALATDLMAAVGLSGLPDYVNAVEEALNTATIQLENDLNTAFARTSRIDYFEVNPNEVFTKLKLKQGFVLDSPAPVVNYSTSSSAWGAGQSTNIATSCKFDAEKGVVWLSGANTDPISNLINGAQQVDIRGSVITVAYTAGFLADTTDAEHYAGVPEWLASVARIAARVMLVSHPALQVANITPDVRLLQSQYNAIISRKTRYMPSAILAKF